MSSWKWEQALFWFDYWTYLGSLILIFCLNGPRDLRIPITSKVAEEIINGFWNFPPARSDEMEMLQVVLFTMTPHFIINGW